RWRLAAAAGLLVLIAVVGLASWLARGPARSPPAEASIAVLPFTSLSSERDDRYFAEGLAVEMHDALAGVPGLKVAARTVGAALEDEADVRALGRRLGVATVLDASVRREGPRVRINARLSDTASGFTLWTDSYDREVADVFGLQSEIANEVVHALLGVLPDAHPGLAQRLSPTSNIAAYDVYLKGLQQLQAAGDDELAQAVVLFREALAADPAFARAQAGICRAEIRRFETARDATVFNRAQAACGRAAQMDPGLREVSLALGEMHRVRGEFAQATEQYTRALDDLALRPAAYIGLARTQGAQGRDALALDYFRRAMEQRPGDPTAHRELGYHHYLNGDLPRAIAAFRTATTLQPDDEQLWNSLGGLSLTSGDSARAAEAFERSLAIRPNYGALSNFGTLRYQQGRYAEAGALYRHAAELDPDDYRIWGNLGDALVADAATAGQAREPYSRAARLAQNYLRIRSDDAQAVALLAWYRANLGQRDAAVALVAHAEAIGTEPGEVALANAQTLALLGDEAAARTRVARALGADIPLSRIRASPQLRRWAAQGAKLR
ncbi:tetratricopeptide repeat protein, partial [Lysobacter sp. D1-1-M9]|uniref:tetratricopeptide repeat protein n=1 Tax=Novilysobacter longmucuonensis TaxID=3098603 RepID=UPI002FC8B2D3